MPVSVMTCQSASKRRSEYFVPRIGFVRTKAARKPRSATRFTSATAASTSTTGSAATGISRPPEPPQSSSKSQSL